MAPLVGDTGMGGEALTVRGSFSLSWDLDSGSVQCTTRLFLVGTTHPTVLLTGIHSRVT